MFMNEYDIEEAVVRFGRDGETPYLLEGAERLQRLMEWTNSNSDGWPYWAPPSKAAKKLQELLTNATSAQRGGFTRVDCTPAELAKACVPIKSFLTKRGVDHDVVFEAA